MPSILGANTLSSGAYSVDNGIRFDGTSSHMTFTPGSAGSQKIVTFSTWIKRSQLGEGNGPADVFMMYGYAGSSSDTRLYFTGDGDANDDRLYFQSTTSNTTHTALATNRKFRDPNAWYHIVINYNSSVSSPDTNHVEMFINGVKETSFATETYPSQNDLVYWTDDSLHTIARRSDGENLYYGGYMCETVMIDGQALDADSFGEFDADTGIWKPIDVSGLTFGTNGFYLEYKGSGTSANSSGLGADTSGNDHHFAVSGLAATDQTTDTCTNNFATWNILQPTNATLTEGNLVGASSANSGHYSGISSIGVSSGKWYFECKQTQESTANEGMIGVIIFDGSNTITALLNPVGRGGGWGMQDGTRGFSTDSGGSGSTTDSFHAGWTDDDIIGIALDIDNSRVYFSKNGQWNNSGSWDASSPTTSQTLQNGLGDGTYFFMAGDASGSNNNTWSANFGSPAFAISSGNADSEGFGNFEFAVPSGYFALCTKNLAEYG